MIDTVLVGTVPGVTPVRQGPKFEQNLLSVVVDGVVYGGEREGLRCIAGFERDAGGDGGVVRAGCAVLVRRRQRDHHRALRVGGEVHGHRLVGALGDVVDGPAEVDLHLRVVVVDDGDQGLRGRAGAQVLGQRAEEHLQALVVVVHAVVHGGDHERLGRLAGGDGHFGGDGVVVVGCAVLVDHSDRDCRVAFEVSVQRDLDFNRPALVDRVGIGGEADVDVLYNLYRESGSVCRVQGYPSPSEIYEFIVYDGSLGIAKWQFETTQVEYGTVDESS